MGRPEIVDPDAANAHWRGFPGYWSDIYKAQAKERMREGGREGGLSKGQVNSLEASKVDNRGWTNARIAKEAGQ